MQHVSKVSGFAGVDLERGVGKCGLYKMGRWCFLIFVKTKDEETTFQSRVLLVPWYNFLTCAAEEALFLTCMSLRWTQVLMERGGGLEHVKVLFIYLLSNEWNWFGEISKERKSKDSWVWGRNWASRRDFLQIPFPRSVADCAPAGLRRQGGPRP